MFYKITGTNGNDQKSLYAFVEGDLEHAKMVITLNCLNAFATSLDSIEPASKNDQDFIDYVEQDIEKVKAEIAKKQILLDQLEKALD